MSRKGLSMFFAFAANAAISLLIALAGGFALYCFNGHNAPFIGQMAACQEAFFSFVASEVTDVGYEFLRLFDTTQGLPSGASSSQSLLNPGADVDLTTSTDFEDLAAPAADVMELSDQDRALIADALATSVYLHGIAGFFVGGFLRCILSPSF
jgi:hypothetical protein